MWAGYFGLCHHPLLHHPVSPHSHTSLSPSIIPFLPPLSGSLHLQLPLLAITVYASQTVISSLRVPCQTLILGSANFNVCVTASIQSAKMQHILLCQLLFAYPLICSQSLVIIHSSKLSSFSYFMADCVKTSQADVVKKFGLLMVNRRRLTFHRARYLNSIVLVQTP